MQIQATVFLFPASTQVVIASVAAAVAASAANHPAGGGDHGWEGRHTQRKAGVLAFTVETGGEA